MKNKQGVNSAFILSSIANVKTFIGASALVCAMNSAVIGQEFYEIDFSPIASIEATAKVGQAEPAVAPAPAPEATVERVVQYRVHRSPVRNDSLAFHVVDKETDAELTIELPGLEGLSFNKVCRTAQGVKIACGSRARIQFVNMVARRDVTCKIATAPDQSVNVKSCELGGEDLGAWIVKNGIGRPTSDGLHATAVREARVAERGMWVDAETRSGMVLASQ